MVKTSVGLQNWNFWTELPLVINSLTMGCLEVRRKIWLKLVLWRGCIKLWDHIHKLQHESLPTEGFDTRLAKLLVQNIISIQYAVILSKSFHQQLMVVFAQSFCEDSNPWTIYLFNASPTSSIIVLIEFLKLWYTQTFTKTINWSKLLAQKAWPRPV